MPATYVMTALEVAIILLGVFFVPRVRLGGGGDLACAAFLGIAFLTAAFAVCPGRSAHLAVQFVCAAVVFYFVLNSNRDKIAPAMAATATLAAAAGLGWWLFGFTPRVVTPFGLHHYAAGFLLLHLPLTWKLAERRPPWYVAAALQVVAIAGTRSMAAILVLGLMFLWVQRRHPLRLSVAVALLIGVAALVPRTNQLLTRGEDPTLSTENRIRYVQTGLKMFAARPLGWGLGSVPLASSPFRPQTPDVMPRGEVLPHTHNLPLNLAVETGLLGLLAAAWFLWRARSLSLVPYLLLALADYQLDLPALLFALAAVAGLNAARLESPPVPAWIVRALLLVAAVLTPFAHSDCGWDSFLDSEYVQAADKLPNVIPAQSPAGVELLQKGEVESSIRYVKRATQLDPYFTLAWFHLGRAQERSGRRAEAVTAYTQAILTHPITIFAEGWNPVLYAEAQKRALATLESSRFSNDAVTQHRYRELHDFLAANPSLPAGTFPDQYAEIADGRVDLSVSLLVFHRLAAPRYTSAINVLLPTRGFYIPPGLGYLRQQ